MKASICRPLLLLAIFGVSATFSSAPQQAKDVGVSGPIQHYEATPIRHDKVDPAPVQHTPAAVASSVADQEPVEELQGETDDVADDKAPAAVNDEDLEQEAPASSFRYKDNVKNREIMREVSRLLNKNRYSDEDDDSRSNSDSEEYRGRRGGRRGRGRGGRRRRYRGRYDDDSGDSGSDEYGDGYRRSRRRYGNGGR